MALTALPGFLLLVEQRIAEAVARGEFDNLPGAGKPLEFDDDPLVPEDERLAVRIMKNSSFVPPEVERLAEIARLIAAVDTESVADDPAARAAPGRRLRALGARLETEGRPATAARAWRDYEAAMVRQLAERRP